MIRFIRLQGYEFTKYRKVHKLRLQSLFMSTHYHLRAKMVDEDGTCIMHWLNELEADKCISNLGYAPLPNCEIEMKELKK